MEYRADNEREKRQDPKRNKVTVGKRDNTRHYQSRKGNYPVLRTVSAGIGSIRESRNNIEQNIYTERHQDPECNIFYKRLAEIIDYVVIDRKSGLKDQTNNSYYEKELLKFKPYRSLQIPHRGIASRLGVHSKTP